MLNKACQNFEICPYIYNYRYLTDVVILHIGNLCEREKAKKKDCELASIEKKGVTH